jgi:FlaA1/EpsC-like NDP-sugar epimerase
MKTKIAIYGAGKQGCLVKNLIENSKERDNYEVVIFVENKAFEKLCTKLDGVDVASLYNVCEKYGSKEISAFAIPTSYHKVDVLEMVGFLRKNNVADEDIFLVPINVRRKAPPPPPIFL